MSTTILLQSAITSRNIIRNYVRRVKLANPGIQKQLNIINDENFDVENLESDFMNVSEVHKEHEKELKHFRDKEKFWIVKQRYFKESKVNFLSWNDKEQIQFLHQSNPDEWTVERLAESFPASCDTIKKIVKTRWRPKSEDKKLHHDKAVQQNWKYLQKGKFSQTLPQELLAHISKFSARTRSENPKPGAKIVSNLKISEFSSIISDFEHKKCNENTENCRVNENINEYCEIDEKLKRFGKKSVTLGVVKPDENKMADENCVVDFKVKVPEKCKIETKTVQFGQKEDKNVVMYPEKINIPKNKYKKGSVYKLNDCYYDDDGEFLYRVPGMY